MFSYFKQKAIDSRANDDILYEYVLEEIESGTIIKGTWAKALANSDGDNNKANSIYMKYRVQTIKDAFSILEIEYNKINRQNLFSYISNKLFNEIEENNLKSIQKDLPTKREVWKMILNDGYTEYGPATLRDNNLDIFPYRIENNKYIITKDMKDIKSYSFR